jgi:transcriptional regulator GlxA family with amidase domain
MVHCVKTAAIRRGQAVSMLRLGLLVTDGFGVTSFTPLSVFEAANEVLESPLYDIHVLSMAGGPVSNSFGMKVMTERASAVPVDTLLIGSPPDLADPSPELLAFLQGALITTRRVVAIGVGVFILGAAGLLTDRRATTHWRFATELQKRFPRTTVELDRIFVADGGVWTSAGMTAGVDLALSLFERDIGPDRARDVARALVVQQRRAGGQSQHSTLLDMDAKSDRVKHALHFARSNLNTPLSVETLANVACLSVRQFSRVFRAETGISPAKAIENLRLEAARLLLDQGRLPVETIASTTGFGDRERMRRTFIRNLGQPPRSIRSASGPLAAI